MRLACTAPPARRMAEHIQIIFLPGEAAQDVLPVADVERDIDVRELAIERAQNARHDVFGRRDDADAQIARMAAAGLLEKAVEVLETPQHIASGLI